MEWAPPGASCIVIGQMAASLLAHGALESWRGQGLRLLLTPPTDPSQRRAAQPPARAAPDQEPARGPRFGVHLSPSFNSLPALVNEVSAPAGSPETSRGWRGRGRGSGHSPQAWLLRSLHQLCLRPRSSRQGCGNSSGRLPGALRWTRGWDRPRMAQAVAQALLPALQLTS